MKLFLFIPLLILIVHVHAQQADTTLLLKEVQVTDLRMGPFTKGIAFDTLSGLQIDLNSGSSVADLLATSGKLFVKSYGPGSLSTVSLNGSNAYQTSIIWNGFKIESPMLGQTDLALLPACFANQVIIQHGGRSDLWGSGSVGGSILLGNLPVFNSGFKTMVRSTVSSFEDQFYSSRFSYGSKKIFSSLSLFSRYSKNDFLYHDFFGNAVHQENSSFKEKGLLSENCVLTGKSTLLFNAWLQKSDRRIPPSMTEAGSQTSQQDGAQRLMAAWKYSSGSWQTELRSGFFNEQLIFMLAGPDSSSFSTFINEARVKLVKSSSSFLVAIQDFYSTAEESFYSKSPGENTIAVFGSYAQQLKKIKLDFSLNVRQEWREGTATPLTPSLGIEKKFLKNFIARLTVSRNFRNPTMNDRYWNPGGNPFLKPESGWGTYAAVEHTGPANSKIRFGTTIAAFDNRISNQILWTPGAEYWSAVNILSVHSRGVRISETVDLKTSTLSVSVNGTYSYMKATNAKTATGQSDALNKQVIYTPEHMGAASLHMEYQNWKAGCSYVLTGERYTTSDNLGSLPYHALGDAFAGYKLKIRKLEFELEGSVKNIFNKNYQVVQYRPMPLRTYSLSAKIQFQSKQ